VAEVRIAAEQRTEFGKGAARRIRRSARVPAVLYGHGSDPRHISLPGHELMLALKTPNVLLSIDLDGRSELALPKDVQRDPVKGFLEHVDLVIVRRGEKVVVEVPVVTHGDAAPDTLVDLVLTELPVEAEATHIPQHVEIPIDGLGAGTQVHAGQITLPQGAVLAGDPDALVVNVTAAPTAEQVEAELEAAEVEAGIEREPSEEEKAGATAVVAAPEAQPAES
jgi:large subunit ribosomal protein L25